ncbi:MAG: OadG family protein [Prevotella sp.]|jgi:Na+-transporting methylmalonyl-CoA/oxaloacetate decarboxylase gamma subunit|nr:OadG family protein [Prevotella sp.]
MNKIRILLSGFLLASSSQMFGQGAKNIRINEVLTNNTASIEDEFGQREAWIELENTSFTTYNVRGMYFTTDRSVLNPQMSVPERIKRMSVIPSGDSRTQIGGRQHLVFFCNSNPAQGKLHLSLQVPLSEPLWIGFYNGNATELIDSVSIPALAADQSYARQNAQTWAVKSAENVTPGIENFIKTDETKDAYLKREDPHGFGITLLAMGIVFFCLAILFLFFWIFGLIMRNLETAKKVVNAQPIKPITKTVEVTHDLAHATGNILQDGLKTKGIDKEVYIAVISMALKQYQDDVHDVESGVITIKSKETGWSDESSQMTHFSTPVIPTQHNAPHIPTTPQIH